MPRTSNDAFVDTDVLIRFPTVHETTPRTGRSRVATMEQTGASILYSYDSDFDRIPTVRRQSPGAHAEA